MKRREEQEAGGCFSAQANVHSFLEKPPDYLTMGVILAMRRKLCQTTGRFERGRDSSASALNAHPQAGPNSWLRTDGVWSDSWKAAGIRPEAVPRV